MNKRIDQQLAAVTGTESAGDSINFTACKIDDVTHVTLLPNNDLTTVMRAFGTNDQNFFYGLIDQLANAVSKGGNLDEKEIKFLFAYIKNSEPKDETEAMLRAQMATTHVAAMRFANRLAHAEGPQEQDCAQRAFSKLLRTFASQVEALQRYVNVQNVVLQRISIINAGHPVRETAEQVRADATPALGRASGLAIDAVGEMRQAPVSRRRRVSK